MAANLWPIFLPNLVAGELSILPPIPVALAEPAILTLRLQCRLDTYFQGSLCDKDVNDEVDNSDAEGVCTLAQGYTFGTRPLCWYKP